MFELVTKTTVDRIVVESTCQKVYLLVILSKKDEKLSNTSSQYQDILVKRG